MTKQKSTKRALLLSALSLLMCVSMLIGSTFAWFTDSVTSGSNIIKSGTLDVEMYWAKGTEAPESANWTDASTGAIFNYDLWEPGYTEVRHIKIENKGTLALKYQLSIAANGEVTDLTDVIDVYYLDPAQQLGDRAAIDADMRLGTLTEVLDAISTTASGNLEAGQSHTITLALKMQESAGNKYQNKSIGTDFSVKLSAIQLNFEKDSFGPDYDEGLDPETDYVSTVSGLIDAMNKGGKVALNTDLNITADNVKFRSGRKITAVMKDTVIDLNGHDITLDLGTDYADVGNPPTLFYVYDGASLTINGEGNLSATNDACLIWAHSKSKGTYIYGGNFSNDNMSTGGNDPSKNMAIIYSSGGRVNVYGGTFTFEGTTADASGFNVQDSNSYANEIVLHEGVLLSNEAYYSGWDAGEIALAEGCVLDEVVIDGQTWYVVAKDGTDVVGSAEDFIGATNGGDIAIVDDIDYNNTDPNKQMIMESTDAINFDGNGNTITVTGADPSINNHGYVAFVPPAGEDVTVSDLTVTGTGFVELGHYGIGGGTYVANNLVIKDMVSTLANGNGGDSVGCAFSQYGTATLNNCVMTGTTAMIDGVIPYDAGFSNATTTTINGGEYGSIRVWEQAHVAIYGAEIDVIDSRAITTRNLGMLTIGAGTHVGTINLICSDSYSPALTIEEGATVDAIVYKGVTYTQAEWLAR